MMAFTSATRAAKGMAALRSAGEAEAMGGEEKGDFAVFVRRSAQEGIGRKCFARLCKFSVDTACVKTTLCFNTQMLSFSHTYAMVKYETENNTAAVKHQKINFA